MKHTAENNQHEKSISDEMLNFCPLCVEEMYKFDFPFLCHHFDDIV